jgi:hypothetical protein
VIPAVENLQSILAKAQGDTDVERALTVVLLIEKRIVRALLKLTHLVK